MKTKTSLGVKISYRGGRGEIYHWRGMERKEGEEGRQEMGMDQLGRGKKGSYISIGVIYHDVPKVLTHFVRKIFKCESKKVTKGLLGVFWLFFFNPKKRRSFNDVDTYIVKVPNLTLHISRCEVKLALRT
jgi:hypothetical protein